MADTEAEEKIEEVKEKAEATDIKVAVKVDKKKVEEAKKQLKETFGGVQESIDKVFGNIKKSADKVVKNISSAFGDVGDLIKESFTISSVEECEAAAERFGENVANSLYAVHENVNLLETSIVDAVAPIAGVVAPVINEAVLAAADLVASIGQVIGALFGEAAATDAVAQSAEDAVGNTAEAVDLLPTGVNDTLSPQIQTVVDKIKELITPLSEIDLTPVVTAFEGLQTALTPLTQDLFSGLEWAYMNLFIPLATWTTEGLLPGFLDLLSGALGVLNEVLVALEPMATWLWENFLQPIAEWTGGAIVDTLGWLAEKLEIVSTWISENQALVEDIAIAIGSIAGAIGLVNAVIGIWNTVSAIGVVITGALGTAMNVLMSPITLIGIAIGALIAIVVLLVKHWDTVKAAALSVWEAIKEAFGSAWKWFKDTVLDPLVNGFKGMVNGVIGFLNGLIAGIVKGINGVIGLLNKLKFDIPDWIPGLGGQTFGFNIKPLNTPQIPLLAQGAVLPANKPFLAVVGDQKHGTNVEAPLDTIKQAVAEVLAGQGSGDVVINFTGDLAQLARVLKPVIDRENRRVGGSLAKGVV